MDDPTNVGDRPPFEIPPDTEFQTNRSDAQGQQDQGPKSCPMCGGIIRKNAVRCRYCGERLNHHSNTDQLEAPHRGVRLLTISLFGLATCGIAPCGFPGIIVSAYVLWCVREDLRKMREGAMDSAGHGLTMAACIVAIIQIASASLITSVWMMLA